MTRFCNQHRQGSSEAALDGRLDGRGHSEQELVATVRGDLDPDRKAVGVVPNGSETSGEDHPGPDASNQERVSAPLIPAPVQ